MEWWVENKCHRDNDLPAVINSILGVEEWWKDGSLHRDGDKPAIVNENRYEKKWYVNGKLHREGDKPAVIYTSPDLTYEWYRYGVHVKSTTFERKK
jgi:hypothetical protein